MSVFNKISFLPGKGRQIAHENITLRTIFMNNHCIFVRIRNTQIFFNCYMVSTGLQAYSLNDSKRNTLLHLLSFEFQFLKRYLNFFKLYKYRIVTSSSAKKQSRLSAYRSEFSRWLYTTLCFAQFNKLIDALESWIAIRRARVRA